MDPQNQNINPDYSFILNKPGPAQPKPKFSKKLIVGLVIIMVGLVGLLAIATMMPKNYSTQATQTALSYFNNISQKKYETAYGLLDTKGADKKATFVSRVGPVMQSTLKASQCSSKGTTKSGGTYTTRVVCPASEKSGANTNFTIQTIREADTMKITNIVIEQQKVTKQ